MPSDYYTFYIYHCIAWKELLFSSRYIFYIQHGLDSLLNVTLRWVHENDRKAKNVFYDERLPPTQGILHETKFMERSRDGLASKYG